MHLELALGGQAEQRPAAADLDVVGVRADGQHAQRASARAEGSACAQPTEAAASRSQTCHTLPPLDTSASSASLSLSVSIGAQKPS